MNNRVFIVIVNYNGYLNTIECLESVLKLNYDNFNVIVVDNSTDDSFDKFYTWSKEGVTIDTDFEELVFPFVTKPLECLFIEEDAVLKLPERKEKLIFIKSKRNNGFAAGNNLALKFIKDINYEYVWLLNNDTVVDRSALAELVRTAESADDRTGMWGSKLMMYYDPGLIQGVGGYYNKWLGQVKEIGFKEEDKGQWDSALFDFDYVIGAAMFIRREFIQHVGFMEEDYFLYYEELDWAIRGKHDGWRLGFSPGSRVFHKMGSSIRNEMARSNSELSDFYSARNRIILTKKFSPLSLVTLYPAFLKFVINRIKSRQFSRIWMLFKIVLNPERHLR